MHAVKGLCVFCCVISVGTLQAFQGKLCSEVARPPTKFQGWVTHSGLRFYFLAVVRILFRYGQPCISRTPVCCLLLVPCALWFSGVHAWMCKLQLLWDVFRLPREGYSQLTDAFASLFFASHGCAVRRRPSQTWVPLVWWACRGTRRSPAQLVHIILRFHPALHVSGCFRCGVHCHCRSLSSCIRSLS